MKKNIVLLSNVDKIESFIGSKRLLLLYATIITGCSFMLLAFTNYLQVLYWDLLSACAYLYLVHT